MFSQRILRCCLSLPHCIAVLFFGLAGYVHSSSSDSLVRPQLRWAQTNSTVYVSVDVPRHPECPDDAEFLVETGLDFDRFWVTADCREARLNLRWDLELREEIDLQTSRIDRSAGRDPLIVARKYFVHRWDRLLQEDGVAYVSKDWKREDPHLPEEDEIELPRARNIRQFSYDELVSTATRSVVVAALRFPWCTQCEEKDKAFVKATKVIGGKREYDHVVFGALDVREYKVAARRWGLKCSKECPFLVFKPDEPADEPYTVDMQLLYEMDEMAMMSDPMAGAPGHTPKSQNIKPNFDRFEADLHRLMPPALTVVESQDELSKLRSLKSNVVVGFGVNETDFRRTARRLRGEATFATTEKASLMRTGASEGGGKAECIELWASEATPERTPLPFDGQMSPMAKDDLELFIMVHIQPLYQNYSWELKSKLEAMGLPIAVLWANRSDKNSTNLTQKALKAFESVCDRRRGRNSSQHILCCLKDESYSYYQREYGSHEPYPYPFFGLAHKLGYGEGDRFGYPFKEPVNQTNREFFSRTKTAIKQMNDWIRRVLAGRVPPSHESALIPDQPTWRRGEVQEVVWKTYQKEINRSISDVLIELYDDKRKKSHIADATMRMVAASLKDYSTLKIARMESSQNYVPAIFGRKQYSKETEYYWVPPSITSSEWTPEPPVKYSGEEPATPERLLRFFKKHSLAHWSLNEALEAVSDLSPEIMGQAQVIQREDDRADDEKQQMIKKMMTTLKKEKGLVDVGEMMGLKKAAETMNQNEDVDKDKKTKKPTTKPAGPPGKGTPPSKSKSSLKTATEEKKLSASEEEQRKKERLEKMKREDEKMKKLEKKEKEKRKQRREADKKRKEKKKKEEAAAKAREAEERERKRKKAERLREERAMAPTTPYFSWGQLKDQVHVSVSVPKLNPDITNVTILEDSIAVHAKDSRNRSFILSIELREFITLANSSWSPRYSAENPLNPKPDGVTITLGKALSHRWDRLAQNHAEVKPFMRKDWVQDDEALEEEEDVDLPSGQNIRKVTAAVLSNLSRKSPMVVAALRYPWCNKCIEKDRYFAKAGRTMKDKEHLGGVSFAVVDIREEKHLGRKHNITCDDQCKLLIFKQDEPDEPYEVPGRRYTEEIQIDCYKHLLPVVNIVEDKERFDRVTSAFDTAIIGFFKGNKSDDAWYPHFKAVARQLRGHALFGAAFGGLEPLDFGIEHVPASEPSENSDATRPLVLLFKPKEQRHVEFTGELTLEKLTHFSRVLSLPLLSTYEFETRQKYQELKVPLGMMWLDGVDADREENVWARNISRRLAIRFSGHLVFVLLNGTRDAMFMRPMGLDPRRVPTFGLESSDDAESSKFGFDIGLRKPDELRTFWSNQDAAYERLESFCASFLDGTLEQSHESAELPSGYYWYGAGVVHEVVWKTFRDSVYRSDHDVLLELYSPFRPQHRTYVTALDLVAEALAHLPNVKVARMDTANNYVLPEFGLKDKEKASTFYFIRAAPERQRQPKRFGGKSGKAEALPEKLIRFVHRETRGHVEWDVAERVAWANREAQKRIKRLRALEKDYEKKMQEEWMQKEMEEFERYKRLGKFDNLPPMG